MPTPHELKMRHKHRVARKRSMGCLMKQSFMLLSVAKEHAKRSSKDYGNKIVPYYCKLCSRYHLTKKVDGDEVVRDED